jgi:hypothetical protein
METVLSTILLAELFIGAIFAFGAARRHGKPDPQQSGDILAGESMLAIAPLSVEPVETRHFQRTCNCKNVGCTL